MWRRRVTGVNRANFSENLRGPNPAKVINDTWKVISWSNSTHPGACRGENEHAVSAREVQFFDIPIWLNCGLVGSAVSKIPGK